MSNLATAPAWADCLPAPALHSGTKAVTLAELYTSEGCNSCPPADRWFSALSFSRDQVLPLAFHVDYWDYIGWKDPFARPGWSERQRNRVARQGSRTVYTPQLMLNGRDARTAFLAAGADDRLTAELRALAARPPRAALSLSAVAAANDVEVNIRVAVSDPALLRHAALYIAVTENNLQSRVMAGENRGHLLRHDHLVRELQGPIDVDAGSTGEIRRRVPLDAAWKPADLEVAAFIEDPRNGEVLQALSMPVCVH
jgi:hypothetical protein